MLPRQTAADRLTGLVVAAAAVALFAFLRLADGSLPASGPIMAGEDLNAYFHPAASFLHSALHDGELPLWNPFQFAGAPFLAAHAPGAAYPPMLLFALAPPTVALILTVLAHLFLLAAFTFGFARSVGIATAGAVATALLFLFSRSSVLAVHNVAYLSTFAWIPAVLWGVQRAVRSPDAASCALLAVATAMSLLSGYSQAALYTLQIATLFGMALLLTGSTERRVAALACLALGGALGIALAGVQLLPAFELAGLGSRNTGGLSIDDADPPALRLLVEGDFLRMLLGDGTRLFTPPPLLSAAVALAVLPRRLRVAGVFFTALLLAGFDFARGREGWVFPAYFSLPFGDLFRIPVRAGVVIDFAAAVLVGIAIDNFVRWFASRRTVALLAFAVALAFGASAFVRNPLPYRFDPLARPEALDGPAHLVSFAGEAARRGERLFLQRFTGNVPANFGMLCQALVVPGYDPILPASYRRFFGVPDSTIWHGNLDIVNFGKLTAPGGPQNPRLLDVLGVRYYVDATGLAKGDEEFPELVERSGGRALPTPPPRIYPRAKAVARTYVAPRVVPAKSDEDALRLVRSAGFDPKREVILTDSGGQGAVGTATTLQAHRNSVEIDVRCDSDCVVVLADLWFPGWTATVDGRETDVLRANYLVRAVAVPSGSHRVRFDYSPASFRVGAAITLAALAAVLALAAFAFARDRRAAVY